MLIYYKSTFSSIHFCGRCKCLESKTTFPHYHGFIMGFQSSQNGKVSHRCRQHLCVVTLPAYKHVCELTGDNVQTSWALWFSWVFLPSALIPMTLLLHAQNYYWRPNECITIPKNILESTFKPQPFIRDVNAWYIWPGNHPANGPPLLRTCLGSASLYMIESIIHESDSDHKDIPSSVEKHQPATTWVRCHLSGNTAVVMHGLYNWMTIKRSRIIPVWATMKSQNVWGKKLHVSNVSITLSYM